MVTAGRCLIPAKLSVRVGAEKAISGIADKQTKMAVSDYANLHLGRLGAWRGELSTGECHAQYETGAYECGRCEEERPPTEMSCEIAGQT